MRNSSDSNLLIGILALQMGLVSRDQMIEAFRHWVRDKSTTVDRLLVASNAIDEETRLLILALVDKRLLHHKNDVANSLSSLHSLEDSLLEEIKSLDNSMFEPGLTNIGSVAVNQTKTADTISKTSGTRSYLTSNRFMILRPHARGGLGKVSVALDRELNREVALKEILEEQADSQGSRDRFILEAEITGGLEHPGIIPVYGLGTYPNGQPYYAMRFIRGVSLKDASQQWHKNNQQNFQSLEFRRLVRRLIEVCNALEYAHSRGVLHRDLKPSNIMLGKFGETMIVDWGLAKAIGRSESSIGMDEPTLRPSSGSGAAATMIGQTVGTPAYMSPEQAAGQIDKLGPASDVYSFGATLSFLLTAVSPGKGKNVAQILEAVASGQIPYPIEVNNKVPKPLDAICRKAMAHDPAERYSRAIELAEDLELWLSDEPVNVYDEPLMVRTGRALRKHRTGFIASLAVLATATISLSVATWLISQKNIKLQSARDLASMNQIKAVQEKNRAEENLTTARAIALNLLEIAENNLSAMPGKETLREEIMDRCYNMFNEIFQQSADNEQVKLEFAQVARMSGNVKRLLNQYDESRVRLQRSVELTSELLEATPEQHSLRDELAGTYRDIGSLEKSAGNPVAAGEALDRAADEINQLIHFSPDNSDLRRTAGSINLELVGLLIDQLQLHDALLAAERRSSAYRPLVTCEEPEKIDAVIYLLANDRQIQILNLLGRPEAALEVFGIADPIGQAVSRREPGRDVNYAYGRLQLRIAECLATHGRDNPMVLEQINLSHKKFDQLVKDYPRTSGYQYYLGDCWRINAVAIARPTDERDIDSAGAEEKFKKAIAILEPLAVDTNKASYLDKLAQTYGDLAEFYQQQARSGRAIEWIEKAIATEEKAVKKAPLNLDMKKRLEMFVDALNRFSQ